MRAVLMYAALAVAALGLASCGGESEAQQRAQFIDGTDRLCEASNRRTRILNRQVAAAAAGAGNDRDLLRRLEPILERGYGRVRDNAFAFRTADPPAADAAEVERIRRLYDQQADFVRRLAAAARRRDSRAFESLSMQQERVVTRARRLTRAYGFKECGSTKSDAA